MDDISDKLRTALKAKVAELETEKDKYCCLVMAACDILREGSLLQSRDVVIAAESYLANEFNTAERRRTTLSMPKLG